MSYDLMVFEKSKAPMFYEDFLHWTSLQTEWCDDSAAGTSERLVAWFMEMKETFPPLNGEFRPSDETIDTDRNTENHLTDYSIGADVIYASFVYSAAEEAEHLVPLCAQKHGVGFYDPQTGEVRCDGMVFCKMTTESQDERIAAWEQIERELLALDNPQRGTSNRDGAFVTLQFENNDTDQGFMQCIPLYPKPESFFGRLFGAKSRGEDGIRSYTVEAGNGEKIYMKQVETKEEAAAILRAYYTTQRLPDLSDWTDSGIL